MESAMNGNDEAQVLIEARTMLPDVLRARPELRPVFDKYGLRGCGGPHGPAESIEYFARVHGVPLGGLLAELRAAERVEGDSAVGTASNAADGRSSLDQLADTIYRRFFLAGMVVVLTAGAVWGAWLLVQIALHGTFRAATIHEINAHGHAQIFGWVGLFVMGFAYQAFPRMKHTSLWRPDLANFSFYLMVFGVFARAVGEPLSAWPLMRELAVAAGFAEVAAIGLFVTVILTTLRRSGKPFETHDGYVVAALAFFFVQAVYDLLLTYATITASSPEALLRLVSTYQASLRDVQIHGFALLMILGVGLRMFPVLFGFDRPPTGLARAGLWLLIAGVVGESVLTVVLRQTGVQAWGLPLYACALLVAGTSVAMTWRWGLLAKLTEPDRSGKFVRAAVTWLHVSMLMLTLAPVYMLLVLPASPALSESGRQAAELGFSHAYYGAVRHAITVGFISLMILGMAAKVVPTLNGVDIRRLRALWVPFALVNVGCALRVSLQIGTDFAAWAFPLVGISGVLEVSGIAVWALHLARIMWRGSAAAEMLGQRPERITADDKVGWIVEWFPATLPVFLARGFTPLANPVLRRTLARAVSVRMAAVKQGVELDTLLDELNRAAFPERPAVCAASGPTGGSVQRVTLTIGAT